MTPIEALTLVVESIQSWVDDKFLRTNNIDSFLSETSENPVHNKAITTEIKSLNDKLGDIDAALDAIIAIQEELIGVKLINFIIHTTKYVAEEGMTWAEWVNSSYNTGDFYVDEDDENVYDENGDPVADERGLQPVINTDIIIEDYTYEVM